MNSCFQSISSGLLRIFKNLVSSGKKVFAIAIPMALTACSNLPTATFSTSSGCGLAQWEETWAKTNISNVAWDGGCKDGLTQGSGTLAVSMKSGSPMRFVGEMENGKFKQGNFLRTDGWETKGEFVGGGFYKGTILRPGGVPYYEGSMILYKKLPNGGFLSSVDQRFDEGKLYLSDGSYLEEGRWDGSLGWYELTLDAIKAGRGVIWGKYFNSQNVLQYQTVNGIRYRDDASYRQAKADYVKREVLATDQANQAFAAELQQKNDADRRQALAAITAGLATQGTARDRTQAMANALAGNPGVSNPALSSGMQAGETSIPTGRAELIALTPPGNARSRNECVKLEMLDAPVAQAKANDRELTDSYSFGTSRDGRRLGQKQYVAYNTCNERLIVFALSCSQTHMTNAGTIYSDSWSRGAFSGISITGSGLKNVRDDLRLWVSKDYVLTQPSAKNNILDQTNITVAVYYGAWAEADIQTASGFTENHKALSRKLAAVNRLANTVSGFPGGNSSLLQGGGRSTMSPNSSWRSMGVQTCNAFKVDETWKSTP